MKQTWPRPQARTILEPRPRALHRLRFLQAYQEHCQGLPQTSTPSHIFVPLPRQPRRNIQQRREPTYYLPIPTQTNLPRKEAKRRSTEGSPRWLENLVKAPLCEKVWKRTGKSPQPSIGSGTALLSDVPHLPL